MGGKKLTVSLEKESQSPRKTWYPPVQDGTGLKMLHIGTFRYVLFCFFVFFS